jgi:hypothetical protein
MVFSAVLWTRIDFSWLDPDPEGQKKPQEEKNLYVLKCWVFSFDG